MPEEFILVVSDHPGGLESTGRGSLERWNSEGRIEVPGA